MLGYIFALISSIFFSFYIIPRKLSKLTPVNFSFFMSIGFFVSTVILYLFQPLLKFHESFSPALFLSVIAGVIWATSFVLFVSSIDEIGLSKSNQWKNLQGPVGVILSLLILGEWSKINPIFAILAAIAVFLSAVAFTTSDKSSGKSNLKGIILATFSALGFGSVAVIQKYVTAQTGVYTQQIVWSFSIFLSLLIFLIINKRLKDVFKSPFKQISLSLGAGVIYLGASLFQLFSYSYIPASIAFTIIQMNTFWTITIGILIFREIDLKKYYKNVLVGFLLTALGILFLFFARK